MTPVTTTAADNAEECRNVFSTSGATDMDTSRHQGHYGIDAPYVPALMIAGSIVGLGLIVFAHVAQLWLSVAILLAMTAVYLHTTLRGKFLAWRSLLDARQWRGDERILDLGCGRGAVLLMTARRVPFGRAVGVDIWSSKDQSGNAMAVTGHNAMIEGVADRVELHTADMRQLSFESDGFDVIVSSVAIHNISTKAGRDQAIDEAWRVLRPGGTAADRRHLQKPSRRCAAHRAWRNRQPSRSGLAHVVGWPVGSHHADRGTQAGVPLTQPTAPHINHVLRLTHRLR